MFEEQALSIKDIIKKSFLNTGLFENLNTVDVALNIAVSLIFALFMGLFIYIVYKRSFRGVVYSQSFAITLVGMCVITCMITLAISTYVVLSLGMVGALSIVRYRTAIKEPMDLLFIFWAISSGIAAGAYAYVLTAFTAIIIVLMLLILNRKNKDNGIFIMIVHYNGDDIGDEIRKAMSKTNYQIKSKTMRGGAAEMAIEVRVKSNNLSFAERVRDIERVDDVTVIQYNGEYNG